MIAEATGLSVSAITGILIGRLRANLDIALRLAKLVGVSIEELNSDLMKASASYRARKPSGSRDVRT